MNWKQFLKPDWRKIVIFSVPIILTIIAIFIKAEGSYWNILVYFPVLLCGAGCFGDGELPILNPMLLLLSFIISYFIWYLISCLIVWVYKKVKNK
jgi:hypothetical protein